MLIGRVIPSARRLQPTHPAHGVHAEHSVACFEISFGYAWRLPFLWFIGLARYSDGLVIALASLADRC